MTCPINGRRERDPMFGLALGCTLGILMWIAIIWFVFQLWRWAK
jgi:hypothetical protein